MKNICPNCEKETVLQLIRTKETLEVRGFPVEIAAEYFKCTECGEESENTRGPDALELAYREYRRHHDMLQPEEIRDWRKQYNLTQKELSKLLGWGEVTLSRYENGALQDEAHEKILRLAMEPHNLLTLINSTSNALPESKRNRLAAELGAAEDTRSFDRLFEEHFGHYAPDEFNGFNKLDVQKLFNAILFFCSNGQLKTKLNKLLFYADFKHFKKYAVSITGTHYVHLQYGPVPVKYEFYFAELARENALVVEEEAYGDFTGFNCIACREPDLSLFSETEVMVLKEVDQFFEKFGSAAIKDFSHRETAYTATKSGQKISYLYAEQLQI